MPASGIRILVLGATGVRTLLPGMVTDSVDVARAMMQAALGADLPALLENRDIRRAAAQCLTGRPGG
jgi:hypothetical protein